MKTIARPFGSVWAGGPADETPEETVEEPTEELEDDIETLFGGW